MPPVHDTLLTMTSLDMLRVPLFYKSIINECRYKMRLQMECRWQVS